MKQKLARKSIAKSDLKAVLYNIECTGSGGNGICNCKK